jgi:hypothetical protein
LCRDWRDEIYHVLEINLPECGLQDGAYINPDTK